LVTEYWAALRLVSSPAADTVAFEKLEEIDRFALARYAAAATRILDAGGTIVGKAHCEYFCLSGGSHTSASGPVHNPYKIGYSAGGSSSGCAALVGAGGAFLSVPFMTRCGVPIHNAVATSAAIGLPIALASTAGYVIGGWNLASQVPGAMGYVVLPMLAFIAAASMSTAPLGARVAHATDVSRLSAVFACLLYALAAYMVWRGMTAA